MYVRRHDRWITSSYVQWGIKNKTYRGPIRSFQEWIKERNLSYEAVLRPWIKSFGQELSVLNFDSTDEMVQHFFARIGVPATTSDRLNVSPSADKLADWAVLNNRHQNAVQQNAFKVVLKKISRLNKNSLEVPELGALLPTVGDLGGVDELAHP